MNAVAAAEQQLAEAKAREQRHLEDVRIQAEALEQRRAERRERDAYAAKRPERWARLTVLERALYIVASEDPRSIRGALLRVAELVGQSHGASVGAPPATFEPDAARPGWG